MQLLPQAHLAGNTGMLVTGLMFGMQHSKEAMQARGRAAACHGALDACRRAWRCCSATINEFT